MSRRRREQLIDEGILGAPHHLDRRGEIEVWRIDAAAVRRVEDKGNALLGARITVEPIVVKNVPPMSPAQNV
jgi:hypothetical protein